MADVNLFEKATTTPSPDPTYRLALGKAGVPFENMTFAELITYIQGLTLTSDPMVNVEIGVWNIDTTASAVVNYTPPTGYEIVAFKAFIVADDNDNIYPIDYFVAAYAAGFINYSKTNHQFTVTRYESGFFFLNEGMFASTAISRGLVSIHLRPIPA